MAVHLNAGQKIVNKNALKSIRSNAQAGVLVQFNLIYEGSNIAYLYGLYMHGTGT